MRAQPAWLDLWQALVSAYEEAGEAARARWARERQRQERRRVLADDELREAYQKRVRAIREAFMAYGSVTAAEPGRP